MSFCCCSCRRRRRRRGSIHERGSSPYDRASAGAICVCACAASVVRSALDRIITRH